MKSFERNYRRNGLYMIERDFSELYTYLELFYKTYTLCEAEVSTVLNAIETVYIAEYRPKNTESLRKVPRNSRNAGRKPKLEAAERRRIQELSRQGYSIRKIAEITGIPRSTIQRNLKPEAEVETSMSHI